MPEVQRIRSSMSALGLVATSGLISNKNFYQTKPYHKTNHIEPYFHPYFSPYRSILCKCIVFVTICSSFQLYCFLLRKTYHVISLWRFGENQKGSYISHKMLISYGKTKNVKKSIDRFISLRQVLYWNRYFIVLRRKGVEVTFRSKYSKSRPIS